jgi:hypothetical protein
VSGEVRHPEVTVQLIGRDGNAYAILGAVRRAMEAAGLDPAEVDEFTRQATSSTYDNLLATCLRWVEVT